MITVFLSGFLFGFLFGGLTLTGLLKITAFLQLKKLQDEYNSTYNEIISLIGTNSVKFLSRYNDSVTFRVATKTKGKVDMIFFLDKKDLCLFKKGDCVLSTQYADKNIIDGICQKLEDSFSKDMKDCVIIMGNIIDRKTMERINPNINFAPAFPEEVSEETDFTIDDILDRINQVGIDNLTDVEKKFLEQYQKDQK